MADEADLNLPAINGRTAERAAASTAAEGAASEAERVAAEAAERERVEEASLRALCSHVGRSRAELLVADRITLEDKRIGGNRKRVQGLVVVLKRNANLVFLSLDANGLSAEDARTLAGGLEGNAKLSVLFLSFNQIGCEGAVALAQVLPSMTALNKLSLYDSQIGDVGAVALAQALPSMVALRGLDLDYNFAMSDAAKARLRAATGPNFDHLNLPVR